MMRRSHSYHFPYIAAHFLLFLLTAFPVRSQVVINEVYYDHPGSDAGWEFVELYNAGSSAVDLTGILLEFVDGRTGRGRILWTAPAHTGIGPDAHVAIAGDMYDPGHGFELIGSIENGPDALRLVSEGEVIDLIGYGELPLPGLCESEPAPDVISGNSLARRPDGYDTDKNSIDFVAAAPSPGRRNFHRFDIALTDLAAEYFPCRISGFSVEIGIVNRGLEIFSGYALVMMTVFGDGILIHSAGCECPVHLEPGATSSFDLIVPALHLPGAELVISLSNAFDGDSTNNVVLLPVRTSPGPVAINEIMYRPARGRCEWMEVFNGSDMPVNVKHWTLADATGVKRLVSGTDLWIDPGGFIIWAQDSCCFMMDQSRPPCPVYSLADGWPVLNDSGEGEMAEMVAIHDGDGVLVERISYPALIGEERGRSIERTSPNACSSLDGGIWHRCALPAGSTPGRANSVASALVTGEGEVTIAPNPFFPRRDIETVIAGSCLEGENGFLVRIFDLQGREVRRLFGETGGARAFSCSWDGRRSDGSRAGTGLYICVVELVGMGGRICRRVKNPVAVADH
jgi:hypothetical protein